MYVESCREKYGYQVQSREDHSPITSITVELVEWTIIPPVTVPVQESVPSSPSARGEIVRVPV